MSGVDAFEEGVGQRLLGVVEAEYLLLDGGAARDVGDDGDMELESLEDLSEHTLGLKRHTLVREDAIEESLRMKAERIVDPCVGGAACEIEGVEALGIRGYVGAEIYEFFVALSV